MKPEDQARNALRKVEKERFTNFDAGAVVHWAERGMYLVKADAQAEIARLTAERDVIAGAAYEAAAHEVMGSNIGLDIRDIADDVRALTPTDALAALHAREARVRAAALAEAAKVAQGQYASRSDYDPESPLYGADLTPDRSDFGRGVQRGRENARAAILALKDRGAGDD